VPRQCGLLANSYLLKLTNESVDDYRLRRKFAPFTNIYRDVSRNLASKPFGRESKLDGAAQPFIDLEAFSEGRSSDWRLGKPLFSERW
jgi:hypothetical protein